MDIAVQLHTVTNFIKHFRSFKPLSYVISLRRSCGSEEKEDGGIMELKSFIIMLSLGLLTFTIIRHHTLVSEMYWWMVEACYMLVYLFMW